MRKDFTPQKSNSGAIICENDLLNCCESQPLKTSALQGFKVVSRARPAKVQYGKKTTKPYLGMGAHSRTTRMRRLETFDNR